MGKLGQQQHFTAHTTTRHCDVLRSSCNIRWARNQITAHRQKWRRRGERKQQGEEGRLYPCVMNRGKDTWWFQRASRWGRDGCGQRMSAAIQGRSMDSNSCNCVTTPLAGVATVRARLLSWPPPPTPLTGGGWSGKRCARYNWKSKHEGYFSIQ